MKKILKPTIFILGLAIFLLVSFWCLFFRAPLKFPTGKFVTVEKGASVIEVGKILENEGLINSAFWFANVIRYGSSTKIVQAGDYHFSNKLDMLSIAKRMTRGEYGVELVKITIPEGMNTFEVADLLDAKLKSFDKDEFVALALPKEGFLFPDTYNFPVTVKPKFIIEAMEDNFTDKISTLKDKIDAFGKPLKDVITMASLLEEEAHIFSMRQKIAGVLWNRIDIGMPLQVDAVFPYIIGKNTYEVSLADLKYDSPYNTYKYAGLPVGPISNPSLASIEAAVTPIESDYLFYLSDRAGRLYFATNFETHKTNKVLYLNRK